MEEQIVATQAKESTATSAATKSKAVKRVTVRTHSPVIYYYPSIIAAFYFAVMTPAGEMGSADLFLSIFFFNTMVVLFDFSSYRSAFITVALGLVGMLLNHYEMLSSVFTFLKGVDMKMNNEAFYGFGIFMSVLWVGDYIWAHLNRWVFSANEVKHVRFLDSEFSMPGRGLAIRRKIVDVFEYLLGFGAGTILIRVGRRTIPLRNVIRAQRKIAAIETFIRTSGVYADDSDVFGDDIDGDLDDDF
jgi:hypothetical protein